MAEAVKVAEDVVVGLEAVDWAAEDSAEAGTVEADSAADWVALG